jgi:hypothetical protein
MAVAEWFGLPFYETLIPVIVWILVIGHHFWMLRNHVFSPNQHAKTAPSVYSFFAQTRVGWVKQNHLTGQASANSTRDYLRVLLFYTGNAVVLSTLTAGYCATSYKPDGTTYEHLLTVKLGFVSVLFLAIFLVMVYATRYGTHFHMFMNVKHINGVEVAKHLKIIEIVYHKAHFFYSIGQRMCFLLIPCFAWLINVWVMLGAFPIYMFLMIQYEDVSWMQPTIDELFAHKKEEGEPLLAVGDGQV